MACARDSIVVHVWLSLTRKIQKTLLAQKKPCLPSACPLLARSRLCACPPLSGTPRWVRALWCGGTGRGQGGLEPCPLERRALRQARSSSISVSYLPLLRADHYRLGGARDKGRVKRERERERVFCAHCKGRRATHTHVGIRTLRLEHLNQHSPLSDPDGGEFLVKICGRQPRRRDSRARFLAALVPKYRPRARLGLLFLLPRVLLG